MPSSAGDRKAKHPREERDPFPCNVALDKGAQSRAREAVDVATVTSTDTEDSSDCELGRHAPIDKLSAVDETLPDLLHPHDDSASTSISADSASTSDGEDDYDDLLNTARRGPNAPLSRFAFVNTGSRELAAHNLVLNDLAESGPALGADQPPSIGIWLSDTVNDRLDHINCGGMDAPNSPSIERWLKDASNDRLNDIFPPFFQST